jgi:hypothetical protein
MQNPNERDVETRMHETGVVPLDALENAGLEPVEPPPLPYKKEPLFNKKVMLAWAIGAAAVWFAVSFVLPIAFESAKSAIVQSIKDAEGTGSNVIIQRDGDKITITTQPSATPAAAAKPPKPAKPVKPAKPEAVEPGQATQAPAKTEPARR